MADDIAIVNDRSPTANMYGCEPCPKCGSKFRAPYDRKGVLVVQCDDCGLEQRAVRQEADGD